MKKRMLALLLTLCMVFTMMPAAFAEGDDSAAISDSVSTAVEAAEESSEVELAAAAEDGDSDEIDLAEENSDGEPAAEAVAQIGETGYKTLAAAVEAASASDTAVTITLLKAAVENITIAEGKNIVLDLNGKTLNGKVVSNGDLTIQDSTAPSSVQVSNDYETVTYESGKIIAAGTAVIAANGGKVTLESGTIQSTGNIGIYAQGDYSGEQKVASTVEINGGYVLAREFAASAQGKGAVLTVNGGVLVAQDNAAVAGNGSNTTGKMLGDTTITVTGGTLISHIESTGYIACGIYHPQAGTLSISGGTIYADGGVGVLVRGGSMEMTGGEIIATGNTSGKVGDSRIVVNCYGVQIDGASNYYDHANASVSISGDASISASAGVDCLNKVDADSNRMVVSGGTFSSDPSAYVAEKYIAVEKNGKFVVEALGEKNATAKIGSEYFATLEKAFAAAKDGDTVTLLKDATVGSVEEGNESNFWISKGITLDLNGKTVTGAYRSALGVNNANANVTVKNGTLTGGNYSDVYLAAGNVKLQNVAIISKNVSRAAIENHGCEVELDGCTIESEVGGIWDFSTNHKIVVKNSTIKSKGHCAAYHNGSTGGFELEATNSTFESEATAVYISGSTTTTAQAGKNQQLKMTNCTVTGPTGIEGKFTDITLTDCTVTATAAEPNFEQYNNGSTTDGFAVVSTDNTMSPSSPAPSAVVTINGGFYKGLVGLSQLIKKTEYPDFAEATYKISGGYFTSDPAAYVVDGKASLQSDKAGYAYMVGVKPENTIIEKPAVADTTADVSKIPTEVQSTVGTTANSVTANNAITEAAKVVTLTDTAKQTAVAEAKQKLNIAADSTAEVTIYKQTYLDVKAEDVKTDASDASKITDITMDITPKMQVVASTAASADQIQTEGVGKNAVNVGEAQELSIDTPSDVTVKLPENFKNQTVFIKHDKGNKTFYYQSTALDDGTLNFVSEHGFSPFTFSLTSEAKAWIGGIGYPTLQDAINEVQDGQTITVIGANQTATVRGRMSFTLDGDGAASAKLYAGSGYKLSKNGNEYTVTKKNTSAGTGSTGTSYAVSVSSAKNGTVKVSDTKATKGDTVTITVKPSKGYVLDELTVTTKSGDELKLKDKGDGKFTFTMPSEKVTVKATFIEESKAEQAKEKTIVLTIGSPIATVGGETVTNDVAPIARNNRTLLPIRFVAEALGATVDWNADLQKVTIAKTDLLIEIYLGQTTAYVNGNPVVLDVAAFAENNRTYLPLRFVAESLGATVLWDQPTQSVTIIPA